MIYFLKYVNTLLYIVVTIDLESFYFFQINSLQVQICASVFVKWWNQHISATPQAFV
jgi:hypothetical protein